MCVCVCTCVSVCTQEGDAFGPAEGMNKHSGRQQDRECVDVRCARELPVATGDKGRDTHSQVEPLKLISQTCDFQFQTRDTNPALNFYADRGPSPPHATHGLWVGW